MADQTQLAQLARPVELPEVLALCIAMLMKLKRQCLQMAEVKSDSWWTPQRSFRWSSTFRITLKFHCCLA